ncbi:MAG: acyl-CoA dehydratase activase [Berryella intestinalis]|nr:acyl-CoA dehydratase activase [Berryella intestinalis]
MKRSRAGSSRKLDEPQLKTASIGIDIGSTATKVAVMDGAELLEAFLTPTGFSSVDASERVLRELEARGYAAEGSDVVATGYGRVSVPYAQRALTEITCHARGAVYLFEHDGTVIDVGGQDTKIIQIADGKVKKFVMNNKCASGTGKFLELMADRMGVSQPTLSELARSGQPTPITNVCTVFADSEVVSLIGRGEPLENIANGIIESVVSRVSSLVGQLRSSEYYLTGGLCDNDYVVERLSAHLGAPVHTAPRARFAGAIGAALS